MNETARNAFADRLRHLGEEPATRDIVATVLGAEGFFVCLEDLHEPGKADLLRRLALAFPKMVLNRLWAILNTASQEQLRSLRHSRRQIVWTLEELAWWRDNFEQAARLLLRLAWAENENFGNNATGIWTGLFQVLLSGTDTPFAERFRVLREVLIDPEPQIRKLGIDALGATLKTDRISRVGGPPEDTGMLPPKEWQPATNEEWLAILRDCLAELGHLLDDPDETVQRTAHAVLAECGSEMINAGLLPEWAELVSRFYGSPFEIRKPLLTIVSWRLQYSDDLPQEAINDLRHLEMELAGSSLGDELRRVIGMWEYDLPEGQDAEIAVASLVQRAVAEPEYFDAHLDWLFSPEANLGFQFGRQLGQLDTRERWLPRLVARFKSDGGDDRFITGYLHGVKMRKGEQWLEELLDQWVNDQELSMLVGSATWRSLATDRAARRLVMMLREGRLPPSILGILPVVFWAREVSAAAIAELVEAAADDKSREAVTGRLAFLEQYVGAYPNSLERLHTLVKDVLEDTLEHPFDTMSGFRWRNLAKKLLPACLMEAAELCIRAALRAAKARRLVDDHVRQVFSEVIHTGGWRVFAEVLGPHLVENRHLLNLLGTPFDDYSLLVDYDPALLVAWIEQDASRRLFLIAHAAPVRGNPLAEPARTLLARWGEDKDVCSALTANFFSGAWVGPETAHLSNKLEEAQNWMKDPDPHVRAWARDLVESTKQMHEQARIREEERDW